MTARKSHPDAERLLDQIATLRRSLAAEVRRHAEELAGVEASPRPDADHRRQTESDLRDSDELLQRIFDTTHILVAYLDTDLNFVRVNRTYAEADGHEPDFYVGKNHFDLFPNVENEAIFREVLRTGRPFEVHEKPFVYAGHPERGTTYWDWSLRPVHDAAGQVSGLLLTLLDVTERVRSRQALEAERRHLYEVLNVLPGFVALIAPDDYSIRFANQRFVETIGRPEEGRCFELIRRRSTPCPECHCRRVLATGETAEWETTVPSGQVFHVRAYPFHEPGSPPMVLEMGVDVTEEKRLRDEVVVTSEAERRRIGQDLHDTLGQELTGLGYLAHNLARRLANEGSPHADTARRLVDIAHKASEQARGIARGLCPVDVRREGLMDALSALADRTAELFGIPCTLDCPGGVLLDEPTLATDLFHIAQEAVNNAVKHGEPRRIVIRLAQRGDAIRLTVEDDGKGLPETPGPEAGMGLRVMKYRARRIGGSLDAARRPEGGTAVTCILNLPHPPEPTKRETNVQEDQPTVPQQDPDRPHRG
ncbi:MAG: PAS domain-containing protein [Planctomycetes bacterium]|nr:PAS domain-containing protein [Planctomycetota bacterium]